MSTMTPAETPVVLTRRAVPWPHRQVAYVEAWQDTTLGEILLRAVAQGTRTVYLMGGDRAANTPPRAYWMQPVDDGWDIAGYTTWPHSARYSLKAANMARALRVDVHMSATWFGGGLTSGYDAAQAHDALAAALRQYFGPGASVMGTPGRTGLDLFQRVLPKLGRYAVLPEELRSILQRNIGQGRSHPGHAAALGTTAPALYWLDARWMYAHCLRNLPTGPATYISDWINTRRQQIDPYAPAFYCVAFRVPRDWPHEFGLLPVRRPGDDGEEHTVWPWLPGTPGLGWCTGAELAVAREQGWHTTIHEGIVFAGGQPDPARPWVERLRALRSQTTNPHIYTAAREILIHAVGGWGRTARAELRSVPRASVPRASVPDDAYRMSLEGDRIDYHVDVPLHEDLLPFVHPEWACMVWGRARAHLARTALRYAAEVPHGRILWWRNDALVVDVAPQWPDDGCVGTFRQKRAVFGVGAPLDVPRDETAYRALLAEQEAR